MPNLAETLRHETAQAQARIAQEKTDKKAIAAAKKEAGKVSRGGKTKRQVAIETHVEKSLPGVIEELTTGAEESAKAGKSSHKWTVSHRWNGESHAIPSGLKNEFEKASALRDAVAQHFTALEFTVVPIDHVEHCPVHQYDPEDAWYPASSNKIVGVEISWLPAEHN